MFFRNPTDSIVDAAKALAGRPEPMPLSEQHYVKHTPLRGPFPDGMHTAVFGLGCFWGAERTFWQQAGVYTSAVGYAGGHTANPTYTEVCSGRTGHTEAVLVVFDPEQVSYAKLLALFWESHDPTQGMRQGNDRGSQYRSAIYTYSQAQFDQAEASKTAYSAKLRAAGHPAITTEIKPANEFYYAEQTHQQYLAKNPGGYCGLGNTGVSYG